MHGYPRFALKMSKLDLMPKHIRVYNGKIDFAVNLDNLAKFDFGKIFRVEVHNIPNRYSKGSFCFSSFKRFILFDVGAAKHEKYMLMIFTLECSHSVISCDLQTFDPNFLRNGTKRGESFNGR